ncbi:hypothetical protein MTR67_048739 [Solanum verrucosum]|uniref:Kiwellin n=1 Tax=Solanum verrucosum TaxID=315347 RepID=A0AAF1A0D8_SOLVR|nr:hypothetical protein MTR67_048739 [Solanum verrucosum]
MILTLESKLAKVALLPSHLQLQPIHVVHLAQSIAMVYTQIYRCSPPVTSSTPAQLTFNDFSRGGDGGGPSSCDGQYHDNNERIVALSTGWFAGRSRCGKMIRIRANNGKTVTAKVVDECDSTMGCDAEHAFQSPCKNNIVDGSIAVWRALGLDTNLGIVPVTWSMV